MNTTNLFVELLVIGIHGLAWVGLLFLVFTGVPSSCEFRDYLDSPVMWAAALAFCYTLGIILDRCFHYLGFRSWDFRIRRRVLKEVLHKEVSKGNLQSEWTPIRRYMWSPPGNESGAFEYFRHRIRLTRNGAWNFFLISVSLTLFCLRQCKPVEPCLLGIIAFFIGLSVLCVFSWWRLTRASYFLACRHYAHEQEKERPT
jgi:hypothetical protein